MGVTVKACNQGAIYATKLNARSHQLLADEPLAHGGSDLGFTPTELLASSLAACTSITLRMYAKRKEWHLEEVEVNVTIQNDEGNLLTHLLREIKFVGDLNEEQKSRLFVIAEKCPIHKLLVQQIQIHTQEIK